MDIQKLRENSRNPEFCKGISESQLDAILKELFENDKLVSSEKINVLASISNILLINQEIYHNYFYQRYTKAFLKYLLEFTKSYKASPEVTKDNLSFLAIYRSFFLTLYGIQVDGIDEVYEDVSSFLTSEFYAITKNDETQLNDSIFLNMLVELLKALYAIFHNTNVPADSKLPLKCIKTINKLYNSEKIEDQHCMLLVVDNLLNLLLGIDYELDLKYKNIEDYLKFYSILGILLHRCLKESNIKEHFLITRLLCVIVKEVSKLNNQNDSKYYPTLKEILFSIAKPENKAGVYKCLLQILIGNNNHYNDIEENYDIKLSHYLNNLVLDLFYQTSWSNDYKTQLTEYLEKCGYILGKSYIDANNLNIPSDFEISKFIKPKYFGDLVQQTGIEGLLKDLNNKGKPTRSSHLTEEEKEIEAEKLFVLFDRMEKNGAFQNFKNPVRE